MLQQNYLHTLVIYKNLSNSFLLPIACSLSQLCNLFCATTHNIYHLTIMKAWLVSVGILFVLVEIFSWVKNFILPLPVYILAGAFIAIASNYDQGIMAMFRQETTNPNDIITQTASLIEERKALEQNSLSSTLIPSSKSSSKS